MKGNRNVIDQVRSNRLCNGCGACAALLPEKITMHETEDENLRPKVKGNLCAKDNEKIKRHCPSLTLPELPSATTPVDKAWGPIISVWEGYATDDAVRYQGSSGGVTTALALFGLEENKMHGVLHVRADEDDPTRNKTVLSQDKDSLLKGMGSRYSPASIGSGLRDVADAKGPCVIIGKPCDIAGANSATQAIPQLAENTGLTISIFCAGVPSHQGTTELLKYLKPDLTNELTSEKKTLSSLDYRGEGWPGMMRARWKSPKATIQTQTSYQHGWGELLQKHRQWRCHVCTDHTGEYADISIGDPWQNPISENEKGRSLIVARTQRGLAFLKACHSAGYITMKPQNSDILFQAQPNIFATKGAVWGRSLALKSLGLKAPPLTWPSFWCWLQLPLRNKITSILGTYKRIVKRRYYRPHQTKWWRLGLSG